MKNMRGLSAMSYQSKKMDLALVIGSVLLASIISFVCYLYIDEGGIGELLLLPGIWLAFLAAEPHGSKYFVLVGLAIDIVLYSILLFGVATAIRYIFKRVKHSS